ncbi:MAG: FG-GAP-like repeat-containing protein [Bryobacteraceae bacterium]
MRLWFGMLALLCAGAEGRDPQSLAQAWDLFRQADWSGAERACRRAIGEHPENPRALKLLGMIFVAQQRFADAEEPLRRACKLDPKDDLACYYLGRNEFALSRYEESRAALERALREHPKSDRIRTGLGLTLEALGRGREAERELAEAARSGGAEGLSAYGEFLFRQGRIAESIPILERSGNREALNRSLREAAAAPTASRQPMGAPVPIRFSESNLPMVVKNGASGEKHQVETMIAGVAVLDFDGDGWPDIYVTNGATVPALEKADSSYWNRLFRNNHDGTFSDVTERAGVAGRGYSMGVAAADYDNDGRPDLFVTGVRENILYRNRGDGTFEDVTATAGVHGDGIWSVAAGWFDFDNDGKLDLFVVRYVAWDPKTEPYCGDRRPGYRAYCHPKYYAPVSNLLYRNNGDGTFSDVSEKSGIAKYRGKGMGVAFADYDHDGLTDVFVANDTEPSFLFHNQGGGRFEEVAVAAGVAFNGDGRATSAMGADFRDYDNDGWEDLFVTNLSNECFTLFRNRRTGTFSEVTQSARIADASLRLGGWSTGVFDFNNDGFKDIFAAGSHTDDNVELTSSLESRQANSLFTNRGNGTFDLMEVPGKAFHRGAAFGDFNRDGRVDVVVTRLNEAPVVLWNGTEALNHWLGVRLRGHKSNREGIGARIRVETDGGVQWNSVTTSVGYGGSSEPVAHFGLGEHATVRSIEVMWPSGRRQIVTSPGADRYFVVEEPLPD